MNQNRAIIKSVLTNRKDENEMKITMMPVVYDDENNECRIGDTILVRTTRITDLSPAKIKHIATTFLTLEFDDPLIGFAPINIRTNEILECKSYT